jgi:hypothetical protein
MAAKVRGHMAGHREPTLEIVLQAMLNSVSSRFGV